MSEVASSSSDDLHHQKIIYEEEKRTKKEKLLLPTNFQVAIQSQEVSLVDPPFHPLVAMEIANNIPPPPPPPPPDDIFVVPPEFFLTLVEYRPPMYGEHVDQLHFQALIRNIVAAGIGSNHQVILRLLFQTLERFATVEMQRLCAARKHLFDIAWCHRFCRRFHLPVSMAFDRDYVLPIHLLPWWPPVNHHHHPAIAAAPVVVAVAPATPVQGIVPDH